MKLPIGIPTVAVLGLAGMFSIAMTGEDSGPVWVLLASATALPLVAALGAFRKARRLEGRERHPWYLFSGAMTLMIPIYLVHHAGAQTFQELLVSAAYGLGGIAVLTIPLPAAGKYQRFVAGLDALILGLVIGTLTFWLGSASGMDFAGNMIWTVSDAAIVAMLAYVTARRSSDHGVDWPLVCVVASVAAYLVGVLITTFTPGGYFVGHIADYAYFGGLVGYAVAPLLPERRTTRSRDILKPLRWGHVLAPYALVSVLAAALIAQQSQRLGVDPERTGVELGLMAAVLALLFRQLAMIAEQRRKIRLEQAGIIATISHELRTPLTAVVGYLEFLEDWNQFSDAEKADMVDIAREQSRVMTRIVTDLVDVARERMAEVQLSMSDIRVDEFLAAACSRVPEMRGVRVRTEVERGTLLTADRERMMQVLENLLSNAALYGDGEVLVVARPSGPKTVIEVHDNGSGVLPKFERVIWERFERGAHRQSSTPGSGIGLAVTQGLVRAHGGQVHYRRSDRLTGACFEVAVPAPRNPSVARVG